MDFLDFALFTMYLACLILGFFLSLILHELGHLIFGRLSGYQFVSFALLNRLWVKDESGKIKLTKSARVGGALGQCLMEPGADENDFRFILYNAGGALINIITGFLLLIPLFFVSNFLVFAAFLGLGVIALLLGLTNIIPIKNTTVIPNDGANIREALKSDEAAHGFYLLLRLNAQMSRGMHLQDFDNDMFAVSAEADLSNYLIANTVLLQAAQLEEKAAFEQSYQLLMKLDPAVLPVFYGGEVILSLLFHELVHFEDETMQQRAHERFDSLEQDKRFKKITRMRHPGIMPYHAAIIAFIIDDVPKARELITQTRRLASSLQNPGQEYSIAVMLDRLELRLPKSDAAQTQEN